MALLQKPKSPLLRSSPDNISVSQSSLLSFSSKTTETVDSSLIYTASGSRRSLRKIKKPNFFKIIHEHRPDPELQAALKRSKLDTSQQDIDYSSISPVPIVHATPDEFSNPIKLWNKYSSLGEEFGAIKVIPPEGYSTKLPVNLDKFEFKVREQRLQLLSNGTGFSHPSQLWNCEKMRSYDDLLKIQIMGSKNPTLESVEKEYWTMVRNGDPRADLNAYSSYSCENRSLFLKCNDKDPWNLYNLPSSEGSLLKYINTVVPGVNRPWLYIEDNYFGSVNYHHSGAPKVWYLIPPKKAPKMESILKNYASLEGEEFALYGLRVQIPPDVLLSNDITLYRMVQNVNEFAMVWPRTFHCGFNAGFNCNEACNIAPGNWIKMGYQSLLNYKYARKTCIPFFRIILSSIPNLMDFEATHIISIMECLCLLIREEYDLRSKMTYPKYQMFVDTEIVKNLYELKDYLSFVDKRDFDIELFVNSIYKCDTTNNYQYLIACKEMAAFCIKDCDLCDSPTFGSCVLCNHINTVVCISCLNYHECDCKTRSVLFRYPLHTLYTILLIVKKVYYSMTNKDWNMDSEFRIPREDQLLKADADSQFLFRKFNEINKFKLKNQIKTEGNTAPASETFEDIAEVCRKLTKRHMKRKKKSSTENIVINDADTTPKFFYQNSNSNLEYVTKLTLKYTFLALEEESQEGQS